MRKDFARAFLLLAVLGAAIPAAARDIPQNLLDHEKKTRAAFSPAQKARVSALEARLTPNMTVPEVMRLGQGESNDSIFALLMAYQKMLNKEAREDKKSAIRDAKTARDAKAAKLRSDDHAIEAQMREAQAKAQSAMDAATAALVTGVASGAQQVAGGTLISPTPTPTPRGLVQTRK